MTKPGVASRIPLIGLLTAGATSLAGVAMSALAVPWLVLMTTGSAGTTGVVAFCEMAPYVTLQALGGPLVDRVGARRICISGNFAASAALCTIPLLSATGSLHIGVVAGLVAVVGAIRKVTDCAANVLVPGVAAAAKMSLEGASGLFSGATRAGQLLGPPIAGVLVSVTGAPVVILVNGVTFAVAGLIVAVAVPAALSPPASAPRPEAATSYRAQLAEGIRFLRADRLLLGIAVVVAVTNFFDQGLNSVLVPLWIHDELHDPAALGLMSGVMGAGALLGNVTGAWLGPRLPRRAAFACGVLLGGAPRYVAMAFASTLSPVLVATAFTGTAGGVVNPVIGAVLYERVPSRLQARVLGAVKASAWIGVPFGPLLAGAASAALGLRTVLLVGAVGFVAMGVATLAFPVWRQLSRRGAQTPVAGGPAARRRRGPRRGALRRRGWSRPSRGRSRQRRGAWRPGPGEQLSLGVPLRDRPSVERGQDVDVPIPGTHLEPGFERATRPMHRVGTQRVLERAPLVEQMHADVDDELHPRPQDPRVRLPRGRCGATARRQLAQPSVHHRRRPRTGRILKRQVVVDEDGHAFRDDRPPLDIPGLPPAGREENQLHVSYIHSRQVGVQHGYDWSTPVRRPIETRH
ncbi:MFS transporter [Amycolatopsis sp. lyj-23]|uniref:MFS transporter n=1 Tax=Amycolatopsis sp. lyj-23 TaxID=2789283 RepID=UPI00397D9B6D